MQVERLVGAFSEHSREGGPENRAPELDSAGLIPPLTSKNPTFGSSEYPHRERLTSLR